jgi:hypothetical protein
MSTSTQTLAPRAVLEHPEAWKHLQQWFEKSEDPLRPWNVSAISRHVGMPQPVVRALLEGPKGTKGMSRTAFTAARLRTFQRLFRKYGYRVGIAEEIPGEDGCHERMAPDGVTPAPFAYSGAA